MGFFKRLIGNEPTSTRVLGTYKSKIRRELDKENDIEEIDTKIYFHTYSGNSFRIEIISVKEYNKLFSFFDHPPKIEKRIYDLLSMPTIKESSSIKYVLADFKENIYDIVLLITSKNATLIFPNQQIIGYYNKI